jgi:hypothetical protein
MCTVTVFRSPDTFTVTMNRDEAYVRAPERKPELRAYEGVCWVAPFDGEKGGTWMGVNTAGVAACLLNAYRPGESLLPDASGTRRTRGEIIPGLLSAGSGKSARHWIETALDPAQYPSFTLLVISDCDAICYEWLGNGSLQRSALASPWSVRSSSGWDSNDVIRWREDRFAQWLGDGGPHTGALPSFHLLQEAGHAERSPLMRREWSATRSITQARVLTAPGRVELRYWPAPTTATIEPAAQVSLRLARRVATAGAA